MNKNPFSTIGMQNVFFALPCSLLVKQIYYESITVFNCVAFPFVQLQRR